MRWHWPADGSLRTVCLFAIIPRLVFRNDGSAEIRWLERVTICQEYVNSGRLGGRWVDRHFVDEG
jgi:hypothetical protein